MINFDHALLTSLKAPDGMEYLWFSDRNGYPGHDEQAKRAKKNVEDGIWIVVIPQMLSSEEWRSLKNGGAEFYGARIKFKELTLYLRNLSYLNEGEKKNRVVNDLIGCLFGDSALSIVDCTSLGMRYNQSINISNGNLVSLLSKFHQPSTTETLQSEALVNDKLRAMGFKV